jgi:hypothetical protein
MSRSKCSFPAADRGSGGSHHCCMQVKAAIHSTLQQLREAPELVLLSLATLVLASMDQCTRGPSITAMIITQLCS